MFFQNDRSIPVLAAALITLWFAGACVSAPQSDALQATSSPTQLIKSIVEPTPTADATAVPIEVATSTMDSANADVEFVRAVRSADGTWTFHVTVRHPDTGWEDYADGWDVVLPDGAVVKPDPASPFTRLLTHPHETEQPFIRSQSGIVVPSVVTTVTVRAHDLVDGWGGREVVVDLSAASGPDFEVQR